MKSRKTTQKQWLKSVKSALYSPIAAVVVVYKYFSGNFRKLFFRFWEFKEPSWVQSREKQVASAQSLNWYDFANPLKWVVWVGGFAYRWLASRPLNNVGPGIFSILATALLMSLFFWNATNSRRSAIGQYREVVTKARAEQNIPLATLATRRLIDASPNDHDLELQLLLLQLEAAKGNATESDSIKSSVWNNAVRHQHGPSAYWLLSNTYSLEQLDSWKEAQHEQFRLLVEIGARKLKGKPADDVRLLLASYLAQLGAKRESLRILTEIASRVPDIALIGLNLAYQEKDSALAQDFAVLAKSHFSNRLLNDPANIEIRIGLAKALIVLNDEQGAVKLIQDGMQLHTKDADREKLGSAIGDALVYYASRLYKEKPPSESLLQRLKVISNALRFAPSNQNVINAVVEIVFECHKNTDQQVVTLRSALLDGTSADAVHFVRGTLELLDGKLESGRQHLEIANASGIQMPGVLNNLAMALMETGSSQSFQQALDLSNEAIRQLPDHPYLRDTRGRVFLKLNRPIDAIPDLEFALRAPELAPSLHELLSECYTSLGQKDLAASHSEKSKKASIESRSK